MRGSVRGPFGQWRGSIPDRKPGPVPKALIVQDSHQARRAAAWQDLPHLKQTGKPIEYG
jgi:hypothetical protein